MRTLWSEGKKVMQLTTPIAIGTLLEGSVYFLNTWMLAKLGADTLAAGALITNLFSTMVTILWGVFSTSSMLYARYLAEEDDKRITKLFSTANLLAIFFGFFAAIVLWNTDILLAHLGQSAATIQAATGYSHGLAYAEIPDLLTFACFNFLQGMGRPGITLWLSILYVPLNLFANYVLVFGKFGLPAMGAAGIGYGTCIAYTSLAVLCAIYLLGSSFRRYCLQPLSFSWSSSKELFVIGMPVGLVWAISFLFLFFVATLFGRTSPNALAAYQIVAQWIGGFSVVTFSLSKVLSIRIGRAYGQHNREKILQSTNAAVLINILYIFLLAILMMGFPEILVRFDLNPNTPENLPIATYAKSFFEVAFFYLFFDTTRFLFSGALLGLKDTFYLLKTGAFCWILLGMPLVYLFAKANPQNPILLFGVLIFVEVLGTILLAYRYYQKIRSLTFYD